MRRTSVNVKDSLNEQEGIRATFITSDVGINPLDGRHLKFNTEHDLIEFMQGKGWELQKKTPIYFLFTVKNGVIEPIEKSYLLWFQRP